MSFFYQDGRLRVGTDTNSFDIETLLREAEGPAYIYDLDNIQNRYGALNAAFAPGPGQPNKMCVHYAMKANSHPSVLALLASLGAGADTVSAGEIRQALAAGFTADRIIFSGVGKTSAEIEYAIRQQIKQINVESPQELERIAQIAARLELTIDVAFRMNPDVNPNTHPYITTGFRENKFGMDESFLPELLKILSTAQKNVRLRGLTMHIGSQLLELTSLHEAIEKTISVYSALQASGHQLDRFDIGGGLGIDYTSADEASEFQMMSDYGQMATKALVDLKTEILTEPGRILVARAGLLVGEVQYIKKAPAKKFAVLNTGMHHLLRPALYGAKHRVLPVRELSSNQTTETYDIVGPICESSDFLARDIALKTLAQGDLLAIADSGAYGFTMASLYNAHELPRQFAILAGRQIHT